MVINSYLNINILRNQRRIGGFGRKGESRSFTTDITNKEDLEEIKEIAEMLNPNEEVLVVARQSRLKPGGSAFTPDIVFGTDRRIIIKDPCMLGLRENVVDIPYDMISSVRRKVFDDMFSICHLYNSACSFAAKPIRIQPIFMSIIFHHYKKLEKIKKELEKKGM